MRFDVLVKYPHILLTQNHDIFIFLNKKNKKKKQLDNILINVTVKSEVTYGEGYLILHTNLGPEACP